MLYSGTIIGFLQLRHSWLVACLSAASGCTATGMISDDQIGHAKLTANTVLGKAKKLIWDLR